MATDVPPRAPVPAAVYAAAERAYVLSSRDLWADDELVLAWAVGRWPGVDFDRKTPLVVASGVLRQAAQDGRE